MFGHDRSQSRKVQSLINKGGDGYNAVSLFSQHYIDAMITSNPEERSTIVRVHLNKGMTNTTTGTVGTDIGYQRFQAQFARAANQVHLPNATAEGKCLH